MTLHCLELTHLVLLSARRVQLQGLRIQILILHQIQKFREVFRTCRNNLVFLKNKRESTWPSQLPDSLGSQHQEATRGAWVEEHLFYYCKIKAFTSLRFALLLPEILTKHNSLKQEQHKTSCASYHRAVTTSFSPHQATLQKAHSRRSPHTMRQEDDLVQSFSFFSYLPPEDLQNGNVTLQKSS